MKNLIRYYCPQLICLAVIILLPFKIFANDKFEIKIPEKSLGYNFENTDSLTLTIMLNWNYLEEDSGEDFEVTIEILPKTVNQYLKYRVLRIKDEEFVFEKRIPYINSQIRNTQNIKLPPGNYSILINNKYQYDIHLHQDEFLYLEVFASKPNSELFDVWEVKNWKGTFSVSLIESKDIKDSTIGYLGWHNGTNYCGYYEFIVVNENKIKVLNEASTVMCNLLAGPSKFDIPDAEWIKYKLKGDKLVLRFFNKKNRLIKRIVLRKAS